MIRLEFPSASYWCMLPFSEVTTPPDPLLRGRLLLLIRKSVSSHDSIPRGVAGKKTAASIFSTFQGIRKRPVCGLLDPEAMLRVPSSSATLDMSIMERGNLSLPCAYMKKTIQGTSESRTWLFIILRQPCQEALPVLHRIMSRPFK